MDVHSKQRGDFKSRFVPRFFIYYYFFNKERVQLEATWQTRFERMHRLFFVVEGVGEEERDVKKKKNRSKSAQRKRWWKSGSGGSGGTRQRGSQRMNGAKQKWLNPPADDGKAPRNVATETRRRKETDKTGGGGRREKPGRRGRGRGEQNKSGWIFE